MFHSPLSALQPLLWKFVSKVASLNVTVSDILKQLWARPFDTVSIGASGATALFTVEITFGLEGPQKLISYIEIAWNNTESSMILDHIPHNVVS